MPTDSILVKVPAYPLRFEALMPDARLAASAAALKARAHHTTISDLGNLQSFDTLFAPRHSALHAKVGRFAELLATHLLQSQRPDFVAFLLGPGTSHLLSTAVAKHLRHDLPDARIVGLLSESASVSPRLLSAFDCLCIDPTGVRLPDLADHLWDASSWKNLNGMAFRLDGQTVRTDIARDPISNILPLPDYSPATYPALNGHEKFKVYRLEESWRLPDRTVAVKTLAQVSRELHHLRDAYGASAVHFEGTGASDGHMDAVAWEMKRSGIDMRFSRSIPLGSISPTTVATLASLGGKALLFNVETGSQLLLDRWYGARHGVSHAEEVITAYQEAGGFGAVCLQYPCPMDDYHTRAESVRFVCRTQPGSVSVIPAENTHTLFPLPRPIQRNPEQRRSERLRLIGEIAELGIPVGMPPFAALAAQICAGPGREWAWYTSVTTALTGSNAERLGKLIQSFNLRGNTPFAHDVPRAYVPMQAVSGN